MISLGNSTGGLYIGGDEAFDQAGTVCAVSHTFISADRLGGEILSHGARANDSQLAAKIVNYAIA
jgi:hypothetical protein